MTQRPQWFLEKVFNLKKKMDKEVWRLRENRCKWFSRWRFIWFKEQWIDSTKQKTRPEENNDMNQNKTDSVHYDTIHQFMNRFKMHMLCWKMTETFHDTIQNSLNRINFLESHFDHEKWSFLHTNNTQDNKGP